ncbi:hypothetical protein, partial [Enterobacter hormaechei]|uniref:hypothetical protein n=1 Tax=Enterobacter hormaechei TaxID=158836 RepID=UPI00197AF806
HSFVGRQKIKSLAIVRGFVFCAFCKPSGRLKLKIIFYLCKMWPPVKTERPHHEELPALRWRH